MVWGVFDSQGVIVFYDWVGPCRLLWIVTVQYFVMLRKEREDIILMAKWKVQITQIYLLYMFYDYPFIHLFFKWTQLQ